jgi:protein TonB
MAITSLTKPGSFPALARERTLPRPPDPRRPWFWLAAVLLHAAVILLLLITFRGHQPPEEQTAPGVSVVFENGGEQQTVQPKPQIKAPPSLAQAPPPAAPPPPAQTQPEVNLDMPPSQPTERRTARSAHPSQHYTVMNNLSFGHPSPPVPFQNRALNLNLSSADQNVLNGPEVTVKGDAGPDWDAELDQWVEDHKYYPDSAIEQNQQGSVRIHFTVDRAGHVTGLRMTDSSGSPFLDQAWLGLFQGAQLPAFPPSAKDNTVTVDATMHFILEH